MAAPTFLQRASRLQAFLFLVFFLLAIILGFVVTKNSNTQTSLPQLTVAPKEETKLSDTLYLLTKAENPNQFAKQYGIDIKDGSVQVTIELNDSNFSLPKEFGTESSRLNNRVDAWIKIDKLIELSKLPVVKSIRVPSQVMPLKN